MNAIITGIALAIGAGCGSSGTHDPDPDTCRYQDHDYAIGETWPAGDDCNDCTCTAANSYTCTARPCHAPFDANPATLCQPTDTCTTGPGCGAICCAVGERCELGVCHCGNNAACPDGDSCASAGPTGGDACGAICCGATGPCPL